MRRAMLAVVLGLVPVVASAKPLPRGVVWNNRVIEAPTPGDGIAQLTTVSHKLYLNDCAGGCVVAPGTDSSFTNRSSIADTQVTLPAYPHGSEHWDKLVQCVKDTFAPFSIEVVTADPGTSVSHFEVMIGGTSTDLNPQLDAGGVAPFISCGATRNNILSFVFPETTGDLNYLCGAVVQEATHVWGLDHELDAADPMTYLELGTLKRFQNSDPSCGEDLGGERRCRCGMNTQNSFRYMTNTFGLAPGLAEPTLEITTPREGAWVKPGFPVGAVMTSPLTALSATIKIDSTTAATLPKAPFVVNAPTSLAAGPHVVSVMASDFGDRTVSAMVNVTVMSSCANGESCGDGTHCLGGLCLPGSNIDGGLGATCEDNSECVTGACGTSGDERKCTAACDAGDSCPSGYECLGAGAGGGVCWPSEGGGCSTNGSPGFLVIGLGVLMLARRRRR